MPLKYFAHAYIRRELGKVGPFGSRDEALAAIRAAFPNARYYTAGYGVDCAVFDIRSHTATTTLRKG